MVPTTAWTPAARQARDVVERRLRGREVDDDVGVAEHVGELGVERRVGAAGELQVVGALDRLADGLPHPPGGAGDGDPDHAVECLATSAR